MPKLKQPSLVCNDQMKVAFTWEMIGMEVDCVSRALNKGKTKKITEDDIFDFLSGLFDWILLAHSPRKNKLELVIAAYKKEGLSNARIKRCLVGWHQGDKFHDTPEEEKDGNYDI